MKKLTLLITALFALVGCASRDEYEMPSYSVLQQSGPVELRQYAPYLVAEVTVNGADQRQAVNDGFKILADYIFGNNQPAAEIAMTSPVTQQAAGAEIAMTSPVTQNKAGADSWQVQFAMPKQYTLQTIPQPNNPAVRIFMQPAGKRLAIIFSGRATIDALAENTLLLQNHATQNKIKLSGEAVYAFYDPPWVPPWQRRNEVQFAVVD